MRIDATPDVSEVPPIHLHAPGGVPRRHRQAGPQGQVERRGALLAVEQEELRLHVLRRGHPLQRTRLELDVRITGAQRHHRADRIGQRDRRQQAGDVVVVPYPAALEVGQLQGASVGLVQQVTERQVVAGELLVHAGDSSVG